MSVGQEENKCRCRQKSRDHRWNARNKNDFGISPGFSIVFCFADSYNEIEEEAIFYEKCHRKTFKYLGRLVFGPLCAEKYAI